MAANESIVLEGVLKSDGTLELWRLPPFPPGPVRVTLEALPETGIEMAHLPDGICEPPMLDPWVELPLPENRTRVYPKLGVMPLPDPPVLPDDDES